MTRRERTLTASICLTAGVALGAAPSRFRIWRAGSNPGDYGDLFYTPAANASVMGEYMRRGNALIIDIEHALNPTVNPALDPANPPQTGGYLALESVEGQDGPELWAVPRWGYCGRDAPVPEKVCCARHQIESGQRCYVSPDWDIDTETREPIRLKRVSLVAEPATFGINLLASASANKRGSAMPGDEMGDMRAAYRAAKASMGSTDGKVAKAAGTLCAAYESAAATLGMALEDGVGADEKKNDAAPAAAAEGATTNDVDPKQAGAADPNKVDDTTRGPGPGPAVAGATASRASARSPLTREDVRAEMRAAAEEERLRAVVLERMPKGSVNVVASMGLAQLRTAARDLPAPVVEPGTGGDNGGALTAGKGTVKPGEGKLTPEEAFQVKRWGRALGVKEANETASRAAWAKDPEGGAVEVDVFGKMEAFRDKARAASAR